MLLCRVIAFGGSSGVILDEEALVRLKVREGDTLLLTEAPDGGYRLTRWSPEVERQMAVAEEIMRDDREVLRALAE